MSDTSISFDADILPLFRSRDIGCMAARGVYLNDHSFMSDPLGDDEFADFANSRHVLARLRGSGGRLMPPDQPWEAGRIGLFVEWIAASCPP